MSLFNYFKSLKLGVKLNIVVVLAFGDLLIIIVAVMTNSVGNLITQTGLQRVEQEAALVQSRFAEAEQNLLADIRLLEKTSGLIEKPDVCQQILLGFGKHQASGKDERSDRGRGE